MILLATASLAAMVKPVDRMAELLAVGLAFGVIVEAASTLPLDNRTATAAEAMSLAFIEVLQVCCWMPVRRRGCGSGMQWQRPVPPVRCMAWVRCPRGSLWLEADAGWRPPATPARAGRPCLRC